MRQVLAALRSWPARLAVFVIMVVIGLRVPQPWRWLPFLGVIAAGCWAFAGVARALPGWLDLASVCWEALRRALRARLRPAHPGWRRAEILLAAVLLALAAWRAWPTWHFLATTSLREDEILNVLQYTSRGFARCMSDYSPARNHIFANVINSILPGADSVWPPRARAVSLAAVLAGLALLAAYGMRHCCALAAALMAGLVALNEFALRHLIEARGYGLIFFCAVAGCVAFARWCATRSRPWLIALAVTAVAGAYTLPFYVVFGGGLLLAAWTLRPSRETLSAGLLAAVATLMLYAPVLPRLARVATGYAQEYTDRSTDNFNAIESLVRVGQFLVPHELARPDAAAVVLALAAVIGFSVLARWAAAPQRMAAGAMTACVLGTVGFFIAVGFVPVRAGAFLAGPLAFAGIVILGTTLGARGLRDARPIALGILGVLAVAALLLAAPDSPRLPMQDWRGIAGVIERAFPPGTPFWAPPYYARLIQANLSDARPPAGGAFPASELAAGRVVAVDAEFHERARDKRPGWSDLPPEVRFVTVPLEINYNRIYFLPPKPAGLRELTANGVSTPLEIPGRQDPDPAALRHSWGHGDTLLAAPSAHPPAEAPPLSLPLELVAVLEKPARGRYCQFLFTRTLAGLKVRAAWKDADGRWQTTSPPMVTGELASIRIPSRDTDAIWLEISGEWEPGERPAFGLLAAWVSGPLPR